MTSAPLDRVRRDRFRFPPLRWLAAAALLVFPAAHAASNPAPSSFQSIRAAPAPFNGVRHGMSPSEVIFVAGPPGERFSGGLWVYWNVVPNETGARPPLYDTMVLRFTKERLADVRLIEGKALRAAIAAQRAGAVARK